MKIVEIFLHKINDVRSFVNIVSKFEGDVSLYSGRYIVDAKSIMGIFSLDLSKPIKLEIENWKDEYEGLLEKYVVMKK